ncbi:MAG: 3-phosphoshikimate 1-carboxyvinyltransferase [Fimbriimonadales bacterium]
MGQLKASRAKRIWGEFRPPSDKSITHRAYMISAICKRGGTVRNPLRSEDCNDTLEIVRKLGAEIQADGDSLRIRPASFVSPETELWCGNSGTTMRLMCGLLAGRDLRCTLTGDESLSSRPMMRVVQPLREMGANIEGDRAPIVIGPAELHGISYNSPIASAQVKSAIVLAGLTADGETTVCEPFKSRDHTERMLRAAECDVAVNGNEVRVRASVPQHIEVSVPGDISSAAFFLVAAAMLGGPLTAKQLGLNPTRTGLLEVLHEVGADIKIIHTSEESGEPVGDVVVQAGSALKPFSIEGSRVPMLIDEIPVLAVLATQCDGVTTIRNAQELRVKESDRIDLVARNLASMGAQVETHEDGLTILGPTPLTGCTVHANKDHRIGMAFAIAGLIAEGETTIEGAEAIATSFPTFETELRRLCAD